jgi:predicted ATP-dependent protease
VAGVSHALKAAEVRATCDPAMLPFGSTAELEPLEALDGDAPSSAELYALLSSLAGIPLTQSIAVTGSVKGFFDACRQRGLTGAHGVLIPEANVRHLMLREDVAAAIHDETFHVHAVRTVDEGLAVLSTREAGEATADGRYPEGTFNEAVRQALVRSVERLKALRGSTS